MEEMPLFLCPRHPGGLRLTENGCANGWRRAKKLRGGCCLGCAIGARHAGAAVEASRPAAAADRLCGRCLGLARRLVYGRICVSCANRDYELRKGKNAKGRAPVKARAVFPMTICFLRLDEKAIVCRSYDRVASLIEAEVGTVRREGGTVYFSRCRPPLPWSRRWRESGLGDIHAPIAPRKAKRGSEISLL